MGLGALEKMIVFDFNQSLFNVLYMPIIVFVSKCLGDLDSCNQRIYEQNLLS